MSSSAAIASSSFSAASSASSNSSTSSGDELPDGGSADALPADGGPKTACDTPPAGSDAGASQEALACCSSYFSDIASDSGALTLTASDPSTLSCCDALINLGASVYQPDSGVDWTDLDACCVLLKYPIGPACTPWGPPVPPAMPRARALLPEIA